ncbi:MAG: cache domain-containing protein [Deltaproteobacteria bacterium]|nr:cache domain-containing protein [Deltaproteobacteria bacterium]
MRNKSLATQLIVFVLSGAAAIFLAASAYNYYASKEGIIRRASENARHLTLETVYRIEVVLRGAEKVPLNLAATLEHVSCERDDLVQLLQTGMEHNKELFGLGIAFEPYAGNPKSKYFMPYCFRNGDQQQLKWLGGDSYQYFGLDWYQIPRELGRPLWSAPYFDEGAGNIIMSTFSVPFYRETEGHRQLAGVVGADLSLSRLTDIVAAVKIYESGFAFLVSQDGVFVTHPNKDWIMRESMFSLAEARKSPEMREVGRDMIRGGEGFVPIPASLTGKKSWFYYAPLPSTGWSLGVVFPDDELFADAQRLVQRTVAIAILGLVFLAVAITGISRRITKPLRALARKTADIAHGDFSATVPETGAKEIAHLARSFNRMGEHLADYIAKRDFVRDTFGRYVTQEVVKKLLEDKDALEMGGEFREVSIIMSDLRGFTAITADMHPEQVVTFLNRYLGKMIEILTDNQAVIDEIVGDGILAFFGAPTPMADHPARTVACALQMQAAMDEINALNEADGLPYLEMGIAVNTGEVVVGNIGSERRTKYSVVGAHVNFTSRIEAYAMGGQVLISPDTYERVRDLVQIEGEVQAQMKGVSGTVTLYIVQGIGAPYNISLTAKSHVLTRLAHPLAARLDLMKDKIVTVTIEGAQISELGETGARVVLQGEPEAWQDVRLHLLAEDGTARPGKIYGKVTAVNPGADGRTEVEIRFTSVSPESRQVIRQALQD